MTTAAVLIFIFALLLIANAGHICRISAWFDDAKLYRLIRRRR